MKKKKKKTLPYKDCASYDLFSWEILVVWRCNRIIALKKGARNLLTTHVYDITKSFGEMTAQKISQWVKNEKEQRNERDTTEKKAL